MSDAMRHDAVKAGGTAFASAALGVIALGIVRGGGETIGYALLFLPIISALLCGFCFVGIGLAKSGFKRHVFLIPRLLFVCFVATLAPYIVGAILPRFADLFNVAIFLAGPAAMTCTAFLAPERR